MYHSTTGSASYSVSFKLPASCCWKWSDDPDAGEVSRCIGFSMYIDAELSSVESTGKSMIASLCPTISTLDGASFIDNFADAAAFSGLL